MKTKIVQKAYKFRIYPTQSKLSFSLRLLVVLGKYIILCQMIERKIMKNINQQELKTKYPTPAKYKEEYPYLKEVDSLALANAQLNLEKAYKKFS